MLCEFFARDCGQSGSLDALRRQKWRSETGDRPLIRAEPAAPPTATLFLVGSHLSSINKSSKRPNSHHKDIATSLYTDGYYNAPINIMANS